MIIRFVLISVVFEYTQLIHCNTYSHSIMANHVSPSAKSHSFLNIYVHKVYDCFLFYYACMAHFYLITSCNFVFYCKIWIHFVHFLPWDFSSLFGFIVVVLMVFRYHTIHSKILGNTVYCHVRHRNVTVSVPSKYLIR